jgi:hypothetical protein
MCSRNVRVLWLSDDGAADAGIREFSATKGSTAFPSTGAGSVAR